MWAQYEVDAFVVVYSITDRMSFQKAADFLDAVSSVSDTRIATILVANKSDLVRSRIVSEKGVYDTTVQTKIRCETISHAHTHTHARAHTRSQIHIRTHIHIHTHTHKHTHTHAYKPCIIMLLLWETFFY